MKYVSLLKKMAFLADRLEKYKDLDFNRTEIKINTLLVNSELLSYSLKVLSIPFKEYTPDHEAASSPEEMNFCVGHEVDLRILFVLAYVAKEVYSDEMKMYVTYATEPESNKKCISFGSYITEDKDFTNISSSIALSQVISLNIDQMNWEEFGEMFPNKNYSADGKCTYTVNKRDDYDNYKDYDDYDDYDDYGTSYEKYDGYNGYSDDVIDDAFEGDPSLTWNID